MWAARAGYCLFTSHEQGELRSRLPFAADAKNGLREHSDLMADKIMTVPRARLGKRIGTVSGQDMARVEQALFLVLGLAG